MAVLSRAARGALAEAVVADYLRKRGCQPLVRNFRGRRGEIDLIVRDGSAIVFVEVKARRSGAAASLDAVDFRKQVRIGKVALEYLTTRRLLDVTTRFDVAAVTLQANGVPGEVVYVRNAFILPT